MARRVISLQIKNNNIIRGVNKCNEDKICSTSIDLSQQKRMGRFWAIKRANLMPRKMTLFILMIRQSTQIKRVCLKLEGYSLYLIFSRRYHKLSKMHFRHEIYISWKRTTKLRWLKKSIIYYIDHNVLIWI